MTPTPGSPDDQEYDHRLEKAFERLRTQSGSSSLLRKYLTPEIFDSLRHIKTGPRHSGLLEVIESGVKNPDSRVGIYAPHGDAYEDFRDIFFPIIREYHGLPPNLALKQPPTNFGRISSLENIDPEEKYVISTRCRVARNLKSFPFNSAMTKDEYVCLESIIIREMEEFSGDLSGTYLPLGKLSEDQRKMMISNHYLFKEGDPYLAAANGLNYWPHGRGIFLNQMKTFIVWVGEEDHVRLISMQKGAGIAEVIGRVNRALEIFSRHLEFAHSEQLGFLTFCPTNLGTTIRCSMHIRLPLLSASKERFQKIAAKHGLQIRGVHGEHSSSEDGIVDISNKRRLGCSEEDILKEMHVGCEKLIAEEKKLENLNVPF